jgi:hypothetical protein
MSLPAPQIGKIPGGTVRVASAPFQKGNHYIEDARRTRHFQPQGKVQILNHPDLGKTPASSTFVAE